MTNKMFPKLLLRVLCVCLFARSSVSYKPVVFMHGLLTSGGRETQQIFTWLEQRHKGTPTYVIDMYNGKDSLKNLVTQVAGVGRELQALMDKYPAGLHLLCYSQGGLVCRGVLESFRHNVDTFISLSSPQAGLFGYTSFLRRYLPPLLREELYRIAYTDIGQLVSVCNYWNDPHHQVLYLKYSKFLAVFNGHTAANQSADYRSNFLLLKKLVLIGGPDDGIITPWQSSQFGFYDQDENIVSMRNQTFYIEDSFGLRALDKRGAVVIHTMPGVNHIQWHTNYTVFEQLLLPHLT